ncbi:MAG: DUF1080 domain-containing protein [Verrucomicrobia subdivision 3 bacterium]|nr:DUF1080 domain-containing protein [Limisphaerales bacterium]
MRKANLLILMVIAQSAAALQAAEGWVNLFNGQDLTGWVQRGGQAKYVVEGDTIVGASVLNTPNSFLCTEKTYGDFTLEYDFKVDPRLNSGVQIRSECFDTPRQMEWNGKKIQIPAGRVHGYQVEIDPDVPRKRLWSAGLYDESRRGWLYPGDGEQGAQGKAFSELGLRIFKPKDWNHVRVEAFGDSIKTWLNGTPCADIKDGLTPRGFIALQVHGIKNDQGREGAQVRWRNLRIQEGAPAGAGVGAMNTLTESEKSAGWRLLWDGKTTAGWRSVKDETFPANKWEIAAGVLTVRAANDPLSVGGGSIITRERFTSFELVADFKLTPGANSGIKYFVQSNLDPENRTGAGPSVGCEYQLLDDERHPDAKLGRDGDRKLGALYDLFAPAVATPPNPVGEWNTARIVVQGKHVEHWLNSQKVLEYERGSTPFRTAVARSKFKNIATFGEWPEGHILLQEHGDQVHFRNIKIRVLPAN